MLHFANEMERGRKLSGGEAFGAEFIYFCFLSTFCCYKKWTSIISRLKFLPSSREISIILPLGALRFAISLSHTTEKKALNVPSSRQTEQPTRKNKKCGEEPTEKIMFYLFFHIFSSFNFCFCAGFTSCTTIPTWELINFRSNPRIFPKRDFHLFYS